MGKSQELGKVMYGVKSRWGKVMDGVKSRRVTLKLVKSRVG